MATRKVSSTLAQYFMRPISVWTQCLRSLAASFRVQQAVLDDDLNGHPSALDLVSDLTDEQILVMLEFSMNLADEAKKISQLPECVLGHPLVALSRLTQTQSQAP